MKNEIAELRGISQALARVEANIQQILDALKQHATQKDDLSFQRHQILKVIRELLRNCSTAPKKANCTRFNFTDIMEFQKPRRGTLVRNQRGKEVSKTPVDGSRSELGPEKIQDTAVGVIAKEVSRRNRL
jgi:hypothetical protein